MLLEVHSSWRKDAACQDADPELFFPGQGKRTTAARAICKECEVRRDCLLFAIRNNEDGIWGGTSEGQRRNLDRNGFPKRKIKSRNRTVQEGIALIDISSVTPILRSIAATRFSEGGYKGVTAMGRYIASQTGESEIYVLRKLRRIVNGDRARMSRSWIERVWIVLRIEPSLDDVLSGRIKSAV